MQGDKNVPKMYFYCFLRGLTCTANIALFKRTAIDPCVSLRVLVVCTPCGEQAPNVEGCPLSDVLRELSGMIARIQG